MATDVLMMPPYNYPLFKPRSRTISNDWFALAPGAGEQTFATGGEVIG
jgi:hypothetical protein